MEKESPAPDSAEELNAIKILEDVAGAFREHDKIHANCEEGKKFGTVRQLKKQAVVIFRQVYKILVGKETKPRSDNPTDEMEIALGLGCFKESFIMERVGQNRKKLIPLLQTLAKIDAEVSADNERIHELPASGHPAAA